MSIESDMDTRALAISVSELNRRARMLLEQGIARLWVEGEVSNLARPASGHLYFSLKDTDAQIRCAWFRQRQRAAGALKAGDLVQAYGRVSLFEPRGDYQLIVEQVEAAGEGALRRQFEQLREKLAAEGLFDEGRKQAIPALPARIGVITSPSGAAIRDVLSVLARRFPAIPVIIYPSAVQGEKAPAELRDALATALRRAECDVLIIGRGGGSIEDLWAFNDEQLARAIAAAPIPIVSAVGHETDFTIADFVADQRAPTPSGAAELVVPDQATWQRSLDAHAVRLARLGQRAVQQRAQWLDSLSHRLSTASPVATMQRQLGHLRELRARLNASTRQHLSDRRDQVQTLGSRLIRQSPALAIERRQGRLLAQRQRLQLGMHEWLDARKHRMDIALRALNAVSPLATLARGYAIVTDAASHAVLMDIANVADGQQIRARLANGEIDATVTKWMNLPTDLE